MNNKKLSDEGKDGMNIDKSDDDGDIMDEELMKYGSVERVHFSQEDLDPESHDSFGEIVAKAQGFDVKDLLADVKVANKKHLLLMLMLMLNSEYVRGQRVKRI